MKKILLITLSLFLYQKYQINAQDFKPLFLGEDYKQYKGAHLKLNENKTSGLIFTFYSDLESSKKSNNRNVIYPTIEYTFETEKDSLINRVFVVEDIIEPDNKYSFDAKQIFLLRDILTKQVIYFKYDSRYENQFPFNTSGVVLDESFHCEKIEKKFDEIDNKIELNSPLVENGRMSSMIIYKDIAKSKASYYLRLKTYGSTASVNGKGVIVLFTDGSRWTRPEKIDIDADSDGFKYSAFISLTPTDLILFSTKKVKKYRLYIYDEDIDSIDGDKFKIYMNCIRKAK